MTTARQSPGRSAVWFVYLVRTAAGHLYTGIATDVARRLDEHRGRNRGARYLRGRGPLGVVFQARVGDRGLALRVERRIKRLRKPQKERLVASAPRGRRLLEMLALTPADEV